MLYIESFIFFCLLKKSNDKNKFQEYIQKYNSKFMWKYLWKTRNNNIAVYVLIVWTENITSLISNFSYIKVI